VLPFENATPFQFTKTIFSHEMETAWSLFEVSSSHEDPKRLYVPHYVSWRWKRKLPNVRNRIIRQSREELGAIEKRRKCARTAQKHWPKAKAEISTYFPLDKYNAKERQAPTC